MRVARPLATSLLLCTTLHAQGVDGDIATNAGFESPDAFDWSDTSADAKPVQVRPHTGDWCLYVKDASQDAVGQASSKPIRVSLQGGGRFYAEAWVRIDEEATHRTGYASASVDIAFYDTHGDLLLTQPVGRTSSTQWTRLSNLVTLPYEAAMMGFRVQPADEVAPLTGAVCIDDIYLAPLNVAKSKGRVRLAEAPQPPKDAAPYVAPPRPTDGANMALTVDKLERGFDPSRPLVIWAIGSSFTEFLGNGEELIASIRERFPDAPPIVYRTMVGGSTPYGLLQGWARHLVIPDHPDVVLVYNFGSTTGMEALLRELRTQTTADIIVGTLHWCRDHERVWPDADATNHHLDPDALRVLCARYGVEFVENRREVTQYMLDNHLEINDLLVDTVHQSPYAARIINANIARHFHRAAAFNYDPRSRERRIEVSSPDLARSGNWQPHRSSNAVAANGPATMEIRFTGTAVDVIGWRDTNGGTVKTWIDGKPADEADVYYATYVQSGADNYIDLKSADVDFRRIISDRCPHGVSLGENIVPQAWTITMVNNEGDYSLSGSITGPDGQGNAFNRFTSDSGQIIIEPHLWRLTSTNRKGDVFTFNVVRSAQEEIDFAGPAQKFRTRVVDGLPHGDHTLRLETQSDGLVTIEAFDVFQPPLNPSDPGGTVE